jgi:MOSC domain-containing protein YiiM
MPRVVSLNVSNGGVPKRPVAEARLTRDGVEGDRQANRQYHGGPDRAVCLYSMERIRALQAEGHPIVPGSTGENVTIEGLDWDGLAPGVRLRMGDALVELTAYTVPCRNIRESFTFSRFGRISQKANPGWSRVYGRVIEEGVVRLGDAVHLA